MGISLFSAVWNGCSFHLPKHHKKACLSMENPYFLGFCQRFMTKMKAIFSLGLTSFLKELFLKLCVYNILKYLTNFGIYDKKQGPILSILG